MNAAEIAARLAAGTGHRPRTAVAICRILRSAPQNFRAASVGPGARCVACCAELARVPPAVAVVEFSAGGICMAAGICACCTGRHDRDLIAAAYAELRALAPSLLPLGRAERALAARRPRLTDRK
jgi:hypothetical protein